MDPITAGALITGGAQLLGGIGANQANQASAREQMNFQREMRETAHQTEVADLRAAGLNPILSALGNGAPSPQGASSTSQNLGEAISTGMNTAIALKAQQKEFEQKDAQIAATKADTMNKNYQAALIQNQSAATAKEIEAKSLQNRLLTQTIDAQIKKAKAEGDYSEINQIMGIINSGASSAGSLINPFKGLLQMKGKK